MDVAELIEKARGERSQNDLAREIGIHPTTLSQFRRGTTCPPWVVARLAEIARIEPLRAVLEHLAETGRSEDEQATWKRLLRAL